MDNRKAFLEYLNTCVKSTRSTQNNPIYLGGNAPKDYARFLESVRLFDYAPARWVGVDMYSISDADEAEKIFFELYNDSGFRKRNDSDNQGFRQNAISHYICFLRAMSFFAQNQDDSTGTTTTMNTTGMPLQQIFYGAPGTGKSHTVNDVTKSMPKENVFRITFHPDSDYSTFVGCYKPTKETVKLRDVTGKVIKETVDGAEVEVTEDRITYKFVPQAFIKAYVQAWKNWNSATKNISSGAALHCPVGNSQHPYPTIAKSKPKIFTAEYRNGVTLTDNEKLYLAMIESFQFPYGRKTCLGDMKSNDNIKIIVTDLPTQQQIKSKQINISKQKIQKTLNRIKEKISYYSQLNNIDEHIDIQALEILKQKTERLLLEAVYPANPYLFNLLGMYSPKENAVYLFMEHIRRPDVIPSLSRLVSTYVHELFHAYYSTKNPIPEIEEPIVEASMLSFLEKCSESAVELKQVINDAIMFVNRKKYLFGDGYYGFGHYLYQKQSLDWMAQYKGKHFATNSKLVDDYKSKFDMFYPFGEEEETMQLLWNILHGVGGESKESSSVMLVIEEINRGNCAQIFGDMFQLLDRNEEGLSDYAVKPDTDLEAYLKAELGDKYNENEGMRLPSNLYIWATMNTSDQSLFPIDSAFKRRWEWKYVPIKNCDKGYKIVLGNGKEYDWYEFISEMNKLIFTATSSEDKQMGYFFIKAENGKITADRFVNKVLFYLYNDVFKSYDLPTQFGNKKFTSFFEDTDAKVAELMSALGLKDLNETDPAEAPEGTTE